MSTFTFWTRSIHSLFSMILVFKSYVMKVTMTERSLSLNHMAGKVMGESVGMKTLNILLHLLHGHHSVHSMILSSQLFLC